MTAVQTKVTKVMDRVRRWAGETTESPSATLNDTLQGTTTATQGKMPTMEAVSKTNVLHATHPLPILEHLSLSVSTA